MKLKEILLEVREYLDTSQSGAWIDSNTKKVIYVDDYQHVAVAKLHPHIQRVMRDVRPPLDDASLDDTDVYALMFEHGFVRLNFNGWVIGIAGSAEGIKKCAYMIIPSTMQRDVTAVFVDTYTGPRTKTAKQFNMPQDRISMMRHVKREG